MNRGMERKTQTRVLVRTRAKKTTAAYPITIITKTTITKNQNNNNNKEQRRRTSPKTNPSVGTLWVRGVAWTSRRSAALAPTARSRVKSCACVASSSWYRMVYPMSSPVFFFSSKGDLPATRTRMQSPHASAITRVPRWAPLSISLSLALSLLALSLFSRSLSLSLACTSREPQDGAHHLLDPLGPHEGEGYGASMQCQGGQQPKQPEAVVTVQVGDHDCADLGELNVQ